MIIGRYPLMARPLLQAKVFRRTSRRPEISQIALLGHSRIYQQAIRYSGTPGQNYYAINGWLTHAMRRLGWPLSVVRDQTAVLDVFGMSGWTIQQIQATFPARLDTALPTQADKAKTALLIDCITNNIGANESAATIIGRIETLIADLVSRGWSKKNILICTDQPRLDGAGEAARLAVRLEVNDFVRMKSMGIDFIEFGTIGDTGSGYMTPALVDAVAPGHDLAPIAALHGAAVADKMLTKFKLPGDAFSLAYPIFPDATLTGKNDFSGTPVSAAGYGATAGSLIPPGWFPQNFTGATYSTAVVDHPSIAGAKAVEINVSAESSSEYRFRRLTALTASDFTNAGFTAGTKIEAIVEVFGNSATIRRLETQLEFDGSASVRDGATVSWNASYAYNPAQVVDEPARIVMRTPPLTLGTGATRANVILTGNWLGKITIGRMLIRKII